MNITSTSGLTIYNVTQLGTSDGTGTTTMFQITPNFGFFIAAAQFTVTNLENFNEVSAVTFSDTSTPFASGNLVNVEITWDGTTSIDEDYFLPLEIEVDDVVTYDSSTTTINFTLVQDYDIYLNDGNIVLSVAAVNDGSPTPNDLTIVANPGGFYTFSGWVGTSNTVAVADVTLSITEGVRYINTSQPENIDDFINHIINQQEDTSLGEYTFEYLSKTLDNFGNAKTVTYRIFFTREEFTQSDFGTAIIFSTFGYTDYYATFVYDSLTLGSDSGDEYNLTFNTNIPFTVDTFNLTFSDTWAEVGDTNETINGLQVLYPIDYSAIPIGVASRANTVTLKDSYYTDITRDTVILNQYEAPFIDLTIQLNTQGEYTADDNPVTLQYGTSAKVISYNNGNDPIYENFFEATSPNNNINVYDAPYSTGVQYYLKAEVDTQVTLEDFNNGNVNLQITQDQYPENAFPAADWCDFDTTQWYEAANGLFKRAFYIRNQDAINFQGVAVNSSDRTATITATHPSGLSSSTVTITQDDRYTSSENSGDVKVAKTNLSWDSDTDTVFSAISYSDASSNVNYDMAAVDNSAVAVYEARIKFDDLDFDFNLYNNVTTNPLNPNFKQYPNPTYIPVPTSQLFLDEFTGEIIVDYDDDSWFSSDNYLQELIFNQNYNASDANNDYHYRFKFMMQNNETFSDRKVSWRFRHPKNEGTANYDVFFSITQLASNKLNAVVIGQGGQYLNVYDETEPYVVNYESSSTTIELSYNGDTPTIGLYSFQNGYTPLASGVVVNGMSYTLGNVTQTVQGASVRNVTVSWQENESTDNRQNILAFWHSTADPFTSNFNDAVLFKQEGVEYDEASMGIILYSTESTNQSNAAKTITLLIDVLDYDANNYAQGTLNPVVEVLRWNGPGVQSGQYYNEDGEYDSGNLTVDTSLTVTPNPSFNSTGPLQAFGSNSATNYSHSVQISYSQNDTDAQQFYAVRARHFYNDTFNENDYIIFTVANNVSAVIVSAFPSVDDSDISLLQDEMFTVANVKRVTLSANIQYLNLRIKVKNYFSKINQGLVPGNFPVFINGISPFIVARFLDTSYVNTATGALDSNNQKVWQNPSTSAYSVLNSFSPVKHIPLTFYNPNQENSEFIIEAPQTIPTSIGTISDNDDFNSNLFTGVFGDLYPNLSYKLTLEVDPQNVEAINSFIGVWTYDSMPFTNIYNLEDGFFVYFFASGFAGDPANRNYIRTKTGGQYINNYYNENPELVQGTNASLYNFGFSGNVALSNIANTLEFVKNEILKINSTYDGWDWNRGDTTFELGANSFNDSGKYIIELYADPLKIGQPENTSIVDEKLVYISFTITNFEIIGEDFYPNESTAHFAGIEMSMGYINGHLADAPYSSDVVLDSGYSTFNDYNLVKKNLGFKSDGNYFGKIKVKTSAKNRISFFTYTGCRYTLSNLKIFLADEEIKLKPGAGNLFDRPPDDIIHIKHNSTGLNLQFSTTGFSGGPFLQYSAGIINETEPHVITSTSEEATISGYQTAYQVLLFDNWEGTSPQLRAWDGANSSSLLADPMVADVGAVVGEVIVGGTFSYEIMFADFWQANSTRTLTIGLYDGSPGATNLAPLDTFTITQNSYESIAM